MWGKLLPLPGRLYLLVTTPASNQEHEQLVSRCPGVELRVKVRMLGRGLDSMVLVVYSKFMIPARHKILEEEAEQGWGGGMAQESPKDQTRRPGGAVFHFWVSDSSV